MQSARLIYWQGDEARGVNGTTLDFLKVMNQGSKVPSPTAMLIARRFHQFSRCYQTVDQGGLGFVTSGILASCTIHWNISRVHQNTEAEIIIS